MLFLYCKPVCTNVRTMAYCMLLCIWSALLKGLTETADAPFYRRLRGFPPPALDRWCRSHWVLHHAAFHQTTGSSHIYTHPHPPLILDPSHHKGLRWILLSRLKARETNLQEITAEEIHGLCRTA